MVIGKSTDGLMKSLRTKGIHISGSKGKKELLKMGYYHGYKGYRFIKRGNSNINLNYTNFEQLHSVYNFDMKVKTIFYPLIMSIETALKNYTLESIISYGNGNVDLEYAFENYLIDYKSVQTGDRQHSGKVKDFLKLKKVIHNEISLKYSRNQSITHFINNKDFMPLWAVLEILDMGKFGMFLKCLKSDIGLLNCTKLNLVHGGIQTNYQLIPNIIFTLKDLRNAVAHNNIIFDCRFNNTNTNVSNVVKSYVQVETNIQHIDFGFLIDYFILIMLLSKKIGMSKTEMKKIIRDFREETLILKNSVTQSIYDRIVGTHIVNKLNQLENYV